MSCIKLNTIIVNDVLSIQQGPINVLDTTISSASYNGALTVDGGIGILCTHNSISSTSGGALTVGGGLSVKYNTFLGNDLILDNSTSTFTINGIVYPRLFLDTINNKQFSISLDGINQHLLLNNSNLYINVTGENAISFAGGVSINCDVNSSNVTQGGSLTIAGGCSINKNLYIGDTLNASNIKALDNNDFNLSSDCNINISSNNILIACNNQFTINNQNKDNLLNLSYTQGDFNIPISFNKQIDTLSIISDSLNVLYDTHLNKTVIDNDLIVNQNIITGNGLYIKDIRDIRDIRDIKDKPDGEGTSDNPYGDCISIKNYNGYTLFNSINDYIFNSSSASVSINSGLLHLNNYMFDNSNEMNKINDMDGNNAIHKNTLTIQSFSNESCIDILTTHLDRLDDNTISLYSSLYNYNNVTSKEYLKLGYHSVDEKYIISVENENSNNIIDLVLKNNNGSVVLCTDGSLLTNSILSNGQLNVNGDITVKDTSRLLNDVYISGELYFNGNAVSNVSNVSTVNVSTNSLLISGYDQNGININISNNIGESNNDVFNSISLFSVGKSINDSDFDCLSIRNGINGYTIQSLQNGSGILKSINIQCSDKNQLTVATNGNIGINNITPNHILDVNGTINGTTLRGQDIVIANTMSCGNINIYSLDVSNNINTKGDVNVNGNIKSGGDITLAGDLIIQQNMSITEGTLNGNIGRFNNIFINESLYNNGSIIINCTTNASSTTDGGALTILGGGGLSVSGDLFLQNKSHLYNSINVYLPTCSGSHTCSGNSGNILNVYDTIGMMNYSMNYTTSGNLSFSCIDELSGCSSDMMLFIKNNNGHETNLTSNVIFTNTSSSINSTTASVLINGGLSINSTSSSTSISNGGSLTIAGGVSIAKNMMIGGDVHIISTSVSNNINTGALVVNGGVGIVGNTCIGGNAIITGDLIVNGQTTNVNTVNTVIKDNVLVLNSGPSGSHDAGFIIQRYQTDNNTGSGDIVNDDPVFTDILTSQVGILSPSNQIKLSYLTSNIDNYYTNWWIKIASGFSVNQVRQIKSYDGTSHIATLSSPFTLQNPASGDTVHFYNKPFIGMIYNELQGLFQLGSSVQDPSTNVTFSDTIGLMTNNIILTNTMSSIIMSSGALTGSLVSNGGISITNTSDANSTWGGAMTVLGGASIRKSMYVGDQLYVNNVNVTPNNHDIMSSILYTAFNNKLDVTFMTINSDVLSFDIYLGVIITMNSSNGNLYSNYQIRGINKKTSWEVVYTYVGDDTGIEFDIIIDTATSNGLLQYSTPDYGLSISNIQFKYRMITN